MSLQQSYTFTGHGNWSLDATSGLATGGGTIDVSVPEGSEVEKAFLYATTYITPEQNIDATLSSRASSQQVIDFQSLGTTTSGLSLTAYRADVTDFVSGIVGDGDPSRFNFTVSDIL